MANSRFDALILNSLGDVREKRVGLRYVGGQPARPGQVITVSKDCYPFKPRKFVFRGSRNGLVLLENVKEQ